MWQYTRYSKKINQTSYISHAYAHYFIALLKKTLYLEWFISLQGNDPPGLRFKWLSKERSKSKKNNSSRVDARNLVPKVNENYTMLTVCCKANSTQKYWNCKKVRIYLQRGHDERTSKFRNWGRTKMKRGRQQTHLLSHCHQSVGRSHAPIPYQLWTFLCNPTCHNLRFAIWVS